MTINIKKKKDLLIFEQYQCKKELNSLKDKIK